MFQWWSCGSTRQAADPQEGSDIRPLCPHAQSCPTLCDPMDCSPPGSSVHGIFQTRILEWVAISYSRGSSQPKDQTYISCASCIGRQILYHYATWEALLPKEVRLKRGSDPPKVTQQSRGLGLLSSPQNPAPPPPFSGSSAAQGAQQGPFSSGG